MAEFLTPPTREALDRLAADTAATPPLERLRHIRAALSALEAEPATLAAIRESGASWAEISDATGLSQAAAKWRWQGTDVEIAARQRAGRKRSVRPSSVPTDLPGYSVAETAKKLGVTVQAIYLRISRGQLEAKTVTLDDGRTYKRVML
jgi:hypothetical protein